MLGSNVSTVGGLPKAFEQACAWRCECIQVYTTPSRSWTVPPLHPDVLEAFVRARVASPVREVVAHVPFLVNSCAASEEALARSLTRLREEIQRAGALRIGAVVLHPGAAGERSRLDALEQSARTIQQAIDATPSSTVRVLVENMAGQGTTLCDTFDELAHLLTLIDRPNRSGVCFDTAHAFIAGYPFTGYDGYDRILQELDERIAVGRVFAVHVNDAQTAHGSRNDRHAPVGHGQMGVQVFHALMRDPRFAAIPKILEVPARDAESFDALEFLRHLGTLDAPLSEKPKGTQRRFEFLGEGPYGRAGRLL